MVKYLNEEKDNRVVQLRKGILELAVMGVLERERHYGYSLVRVLAEIGGIALREGTIYPILARLNRDGLVNSEWVESDQGPPRKYYSLSSSGRRLFAELRDEFDQLVSLVRGEWATNSKTDGGGAGKKLFVRKR